MRVLARPDSGNASTDACHLLYYPPLPGCPHNTHAPEDTMATAARLVMGLVLQHHTSSLATYQVAKNPSALELLLPVVVCLTAVPGVLVWACILRM